MELEKNQEKEEKKTKQTMKSRRNIFINIFLSFSFNSSIEDKTEGEMRIFQLTKGRLSTKKAIKEKSKRQSMRFSKIYFYFGSEAKKNDTSIDVAGREEKRFSLFGFRIETKKRESLNFHRFQFSIRSVRKFSVVHGIDEFRSAEESFA